MGRGPWAMGHGPWALGVRILVNGGFEIIIWYQNSLHDTNGWPPYSKPSPMCRNNHYETKTSLLHKRPRY